MKAPLFFAALCLLVAGLSCQPQVSAPPQAPPPTTTGNAGISTPSSATGADALSSDKPDDPGMTRAHDKTLAQEEPSGDESSRAAPNDGDAEPPR